MREAEVTKKIMELLFQELKGHNYSENENIKFDFQLNNKYRCETERDFLYTLPNGYSITHKSDIVIVGTDDIYGLNPSNKFVSIEVKHESSVTDQFKCRVYDIQHLKANYLNCLGVMIYVKGNTGISPEHAEKLCYSYDYFFSTSLDKLSRESITPLITKIKQFLS